MNFPSHSRYHSFSATTPLDAAASTVMALLIFACMVLLICATACLVASARGGKTSTTRKKNKRVRWNDVGDAYLKERYFDERRIGSMGYSSGVGLGLYSDHV
ncbi:hypothetical protein CCMA1212_004343 [Trichoderma ghanense]|uniref:SSCRP protein n=1 Tax=Trichoderma ghanense TaxID=65468 RepID=A0ABY2H5C7_9HYPO